MPVSAAPQSMRLIAPRIAWRLAFVSPSLGGLWAAAAAGLGVTVRTPTGLPASVRALAPGGGRLAAVAFARPCPASRRGGARPAAVSRLASIMLQALRDGLAAERDVRVYPPNLAADAPQPVPTA